MTHRRLPLLLAAFLLAGCRMQPDERAASGLARRIVPEYASRIRFVHIPDTADVFGLRMRGRKLEIRGNNAVSMAAGLNHYLKSYCLTSVSWFADDPVEYPAVMPRVEGEIRIRARVPMRYFLNYCTFGYSMPWWQWRDWERLIDWMALNGINMPLAVSGQEAIWQDIWKKHGLTDEEIRSYFTGPAHLPWHRMGNIDGVDSPLPQGWIDHQVALQGQILSRERELGMTPVLPAFNGHVPARFKELHPEAAITDVSAWGGFGPEHLCHFLSPADSLFQMLQSEYLARQEALWGTDHLYGMDLFNEVEAPSWEPDALAELSRCAYASLAAADPEATWVQMGWLFHYDRKHWTPGNVRAYLQAVPPGKVVLSDFYTEHTPVWTLTESFYGQPYLFCYLGNFGGNTRLTGPFHTMSQRLSDVMAEGGDNWQGVGATLEGFAVNSLLFEYLFDRVWETGLTDEEWVARWADIRAGRGDDTIRESWKTLTDSCFVHGSISEGPLVCGRPCLEGYWHWTVIHKLFYDNAILLRCWDTLLESESDRASYRYDLVNFGCQFLGNCFPVLRDRFTQAYKEGNREQAEMIASQMRSLLADVDRLAGCEPGFRLDRWLSAAASFADSPEEEAYYLVNARHILTTWGEGKSLKDYGSRLWNGLIASYYAPRWERFLDEVLTCMQEGRPFDQAAFDREIDAFEADWVAGKTPPVPEAEPVEDVRAFARALRDRYAPYAF